MEKRMRRKLKWILWKQVWANIKTMFDRSCTLEEVFSGIDSYYYDDIIETIEDREIPKFIKELSTWNEKTLFENIDNPNLVKVLSNYPKSILEISYERLVEVFDGAGNELFEELWGKRTGTTAYRQKLWEGFCGSKRSFLDDFIRNYANSINEFLYWWAADKAEEQKLAMIKKAEQKMSAVGIAMLLKDHCEFEIVSGFLKVMSPEKIGRFFENMGLEHLLKMLTKDSGYVEFLVGKIDVCDYLTSEDLAQLFEMWYAVDNSLILRAFSLEQRAVIYNALVNADNPDRNYISRNWYVDVLNDKIEENSYRFYGTLSREAKADCIEDFLKNERLSVAKKFLEDAKKLRELDLTEEAWLAYIAQHDN